MVQKNILLVVALFFAITGFSQTDEKIYDAGELDSQPVFAQGKMTLNDFLKFYQNYPDEAIQKNASGTVVVSMIISSEGEVLSSSVAKGVEASLDKEALRLADMMPTFTPAKVNGNAVASKIKMGIPFGNTAKPVATMSSAPATTSASSTINKVSKAPAAPVKKYPLYVIDGKIVNEDINVNADNIESVRVIKGKKAIEKYGERAADGVIIFTTKNVTTK